MITNTDRSRYFGASDTAMIMGNWDTISFRDWWGVKSGLITSSYSSYAMQVGNIMEIPIIKALENTQGRIRLGKRPVYRFHRLRVNYDGLQFRRVIEIKTTGKGFDTPPKNYWQQAQVLMYALRRRKCSLFSYLLVESDYETPYFAEIDLDRIKEHVIFYDRRWIQQEYLPRLRYLAKCLSKRRFPVERDVA